MGIFAWGIIFTIKNIIDKHSVIFIKNLLGKSGFHRAISASFGDGWSDDIDSTTIIGAIKIKKQFCAFNPSLNQNVGRRVIDEF